MRRTLMLLAGLGCGGLAWGSAPGGMGAMASRLWEEAESFEEREDWTAAAQRFEMVRRAEPGWIQADARRARALDRSGQTAAAEAAYREAIDEAARVSAARDEIDLAKELAEMLLREERRSASLRLLEPYAEAYGGDAEIMRLIGLSVVLDDPGRAATWLEAYLAFGENEPLPVQATAELTRAVFVELTEAGEHARAKELLDRVMHDVNGTRELLEPLLDDATMRERARRLAAASGRPLSLALRGRLQRLRLRVDEPDVLQSIDALVVQAPHSAEVRGLRAEALIAQGRLAEADVELGMAEALDPMDPRWPLRSAQILPDAFAGRYDVEAAQAWERALSLQPGRGDLWLARGRLALRLNRLDEARQALVRAERHGDSATKKVAQILLLGLERERLPPTMPEAGQACPERVLPDNCRALFLAMVYHRRGSTGDRQVALQHVAVARAGAEDWVRAINLQASIHRALAESSASGSVHRDRSLALYARSLELQPAQPSILVHLGKLHERNGEQELAVQRWRQAVALRGQQSGAAHFYLGRHYERMGELWTAQRHLESYFAGANVDALPAPLHAQAMQLRSRVDQMIYTIYGASGVGVAAAIAAPTVWWLSRRTGHGLQRLLERAPGAWRDVARICSALRHEVLKHNTTLLDGVADALDEGDSGPSIWAAERLFSEDGAVSRFGRYTRELEEIGRSHGVRLDLARADPVMGPLCAAMARLSSLRRPLERGQSRIADDLRALSRQLNGQSYRALGAFIRHMCLLRVDRALVEQAWAMVCGEAAFVDARVPNLGVEVPDEVLWVRMFRGDLLDILANVLRNGLQASIEGGGSRMAVEIEIDEDWITGLERVAFRVKDQAPARITTALIRSRYIERGLGLTVDMISRSGGSIHVEDEDGWSKAVVVRIPRAERPTEDA